MRLLVLTLLSLGALSKVYYSDAVLDSTDAHGIKKYHGGSKIDVSISGQPTVEGVDFTYELTNPEIGGVLYWVLAKPDITLNTDDVRMGRKALHPNCHSQAKQLDEAIHPIHLACTLKVGERYKIWFVKDKDGNGHGQHVVTPGGVPINVQRPNPSVKVDVIRSSIKKSGFQFNYKIANFIPGGGFYWMVVSESAGVPGITQILNAATGGSAMSGSGEQRDNNQHTITVNGNLQAGKVYMLYMVLDRDRKTTRGAFLATDPGKRVLVPHATSLAWSVNSITSRQFRLSWRLTHFTSGGKVYYMLVAPGSPAPTAQQIFQGTGGVKSAGSFQKNDDEHTNTIISNNGFETGKTYMMYMAYDVDGKGGGITKTQGQMVKIPLNTRVTIRVSSGLTNVHGFQWSYRFQDPSLPNGKMYCALTTDKVHYDQDPLGIRSGRGALWTGVYDQSDETEHTIKVTKELKQGTTYPLWCATDPDGTGNHMKIEKTNMVIVPVIDCGQQIYSLPAHAVSRCSGDTGYGGDKCSVKCEAGYTGGPAMYTCTEQGQWSGSITCQAVNCGNIPGLLDMHAVTASQCAGTFGSAPCSVKCITGYQGRAADYTCQQDGTWSGSIQCSVIDCGASIPGLDMHATANCRGNSMYGGQGCLAKCNGGFTGQNQYSCGIDGRWVGSLTCKAVDCGAIIPGLNQMHATANCNGRTKYQGPGCRATCLEGFSGQPGNFVCGQDGQWTGSVTCMAIDCGSMIQNLPMHAISNCQQTKFGSTCAATCDAGFESPPTPYRCEKNGKWSATMSAIMCNPVNCGTVIPGLVNAVPEDLTGKTTFGSDPVDVNCETGFSGDSSKFTCGDDGMWKGQIACSVITCPDQVPGVNNAQSRCADTQFGSMCVVHCNAGWQDAVNDVGMYRCSEKGTWVGKPAIKCTQNKCPVKIPGLSGMFATADCSHSNYFGSNGCPAHCMAGHKGQAQNFKCQADGHWLGTIKCTAVSCGKIPGLVHANAMCAGSDTFGKTCAVECIVGYTGPTASCSCTKTGDWHCSGVGPGHGPKCAPVDCGKLDPVPGSSVQVTDTFFEGKGAKMSCKKGWVGDTKDYRCNEKAKWEPVKGALTCTPKDCGDIQSSLPENSRVMKGFGSTFGSKVTVGCTEGYGGSTSEFTCDENGQWAGKLACRETNDCGKTVQNLPKNANAQCAGNTRYKGDPCTATCAEGFKGTGTYTCSSAGVWTGGISCNKMQCGSIKNLPTGAIPDYAQGTSFGSTAMVKCPIGTTGDSATYRCGANGWEGNLKCTPSDCGKTLPQLDQNARNLCTNTVYGSSCTARCKEGFTGGSATYFCDKNSAWRAPSDPLVCKAIVCDALSSIIDPNAQITNQGGNIYGSQVTVACKGNWLGGSSTYSCQEDGKWHGHLVCKEPPAKKSTSVSVSAVPRDCGVEFTYQLANPQTQGKLYYAVVKSSNKKTMSFQDVMNARRTSQDIVSAGNFPQKDNKLREAFLSMKFEPDQTYTLYVALDKDGNGGNGIVTQKLNFYVPRPDSVAIGVDNITPDSFTMNYEYSSESMPQNGGSSDGSLYYAVTSTDIYGLTLPIDIKTGKGTYTHGRTPKPQQPRQSGSIPITANLIPGKNYFLWVATESGSRGQTGLSLISKNPTVIKVPSTTLTDVKVPTSGPAGIQFTYKMNSIVPRTGKVYYSISTDQQMLSARDIKDHAHAVCYNSVEQGNTYEHSVNVNCPLTAGSYLLWVATDECGGGCGLGLATPTGVRFQVKGGNGGAVSPGNGNTVRVSVDPNSVTSHSIRFDYQLATGQVGGKIYWTITTTAGMVDPDLIRTGSIGSCGGFHTIMDRMTHEQVVYCQLISNTVYYLWVVSDTDGHGTGMKVNTPGGRMFKSHGSNALKSANPLSAEAGSRTLLYFIVTAVFLLIVVWSGILAYRFRQSRKFANRYTDALNLEQTEQI